MNVLTFRIIHLGRLSKHTDNASFCVHIFAHYVRLFLIFAPHFVFELFLHFLAHHLGTKWSVLGGLQCASER